MTTFNKHNSIFELIFLSLITVDILSVEKFFNILFSALIKNWSIVNSLHIVLLVLNLKLGAP